MTQAIALIQSNLSDEKRINCQTLLVLLTQMENILNRLIEKNVNSTDDFDWMCQMRYYFDEENIDMKMLTSKLSYGFEYIGNKSQLILTPSTERCYRAIFVALNHHYGVAMQVSSTKNYNERHEINEKKNKCREQLEREKRKLSIP